MEVVECDLLFFFKIIIKKGNFWKCTREVIPDVILMLLHREFEEMHLGFSFYFTPILRLIAIGTY